MYYVTINFSCSFSEREKKTPQFDDQTATALVPANDDDSAFRLTLGDPQQKGE